MICVGVQISNPSRTRGNDVRRRRGPEGGQIRKENLLLVSRHASTSRHVRRSQRPRRPRVQNPHQSPQRVSSPRRIPRERLSSETNSSPSTSEDFARRARVRRRQGVRIFRLLIFLFFCVLFLAQVVRIIVLCTSTALPSALDVGVSDLLRTRFFVVRDAGSDGSSSSGRSFNDDA